MKTIQSIDRAISILDFIAKNNNCRLIDICNFFNLNKSTVYGIIATLEYNNLIYKDNFTSRYSLGSKIFQLSAKYEENLSIKKITKPYLQYLTSKFSETTHLAIFSNFEALYIDKVESPHSIRMTSKVGSTDPLFATAIGKCILANMPTDKFEYFINNSDLYAITDYSITNKENLNKELNIIRNQGFALDLEELELGLNCIAAPIKNSLGEALGAISISIPSSRFSKKLLDNIKFELLKVCNEISTNI